MSEPGDATSRPHHAHRPPLEVIREFNDRGLQWLFEDPRNVREALQLVAPELATLLDFDRAVRVNRTFIPADLQKQESDVLFRVPFLPTVAADLGEVWVYLLLENQTRPDRLMALRELLYMREIWELQQREWVDKRTLGDEQFLLPVVPMVLYTGERAWNTPIRLAGLMKVPPGVERFVPGWETLFLNLHETPSEVLTQFATAVGWALRVMQAERVPAAEMERLLREAMAGIEGLSEEQAGQWVRVAWFFMLLISHRRKEQDLMEVVFEKARESKFREEEDFADVGPTIAQTIAAKAAAEGAAEGEARGAEQTAREDVETVLVERFGALPAEIQEALATADRETLRTWLRRAVKAPTLDDVGIHARDQKRKEG